jgi:comEA protein
MSVTSCLVIGLLFVGVAVQPIRSLGCAVSTRPMKFRSFLPSAACPPQGRQATLPVQTQKSSQIPAATIDINRASAEDIQKLPGIGPTLARRIVVYRRKHGLFRRVEDLMAIKGIGMKKWKALRPYVRVGSGAERK